MIVQHILTHSLFFGVVALGYLYLIMRTFSPRVWGYSDYPDAIKSKVPPQTRSEKRLASIIAIPWLLFILGFPIASTYLLKSKLGNEIPFSIAFLNLLALAMVVNFGDWVILDWALISKVTPPYVILPGTEAEDYKDLSDHYRAQARATIVLIVVVLIMAGIVTYL